ncbi:MAG: DUF3854 domain-containing protein [Erysipelotrichaceae bacterium]|nr:DUF3854 domain-containing protein [Erysipelotrichaceae bacterium]
MSNEVLMEKVIALNYSEEDLRIRGSSATVRNCPECNRTWKFNINLAKGVCRCPACDWSGSAVALHSKLRGITRDAAYAELCDSAVPVIKKVYTKEIETASPMVRSAVYMRMINAGELNQKHYDNLIERGLSSQSVKGRYASCSSIPSAEKVFKGIPKLFYNSTSDTVKGVPGVFGNVKYDVATDNELFDEIEFNLPNNGFIIPIVSHEGERMRISCCQIRMDKGDTRYIFLSSINKKNGVSVGDCNKIHYTRNFWQDGKMVIPKVVCMTEGPLKADVASELSGKYFIAIPGVNACGNLEEELVFLKNHGCEKIELYFDMDYKTNEYVEKAIKRIGKMVSGVGFKGEQMIWDPAYKGIDDWFLARKMRRDKALEKKKG